MDEHAPAALRAGTVVGEFGCMLNQVNLEQGANNNKFYKLQLIQAGGSYVQWVRYGRVGETGASTMKTWDTEEEAVKCFTAQFKAKTANNWDSRNTNFVKKKGKTFFPRQRERERQRQRDR